MVQYIDSNFNKHSHIHVKSLHHNFLYLNKEIREFKPKLAVKIH
jgi:hypothetical protein